MVKIRVFLCLLFVRDVVVDKELKKYFCGLSGDNCCVLCVNVMVLLLCFMNVCRVFFSN